VTVELPNEQLQRFVKPILQSLGFELIDLEYFGHGSKGILRVFIEKEGGITLEDCAKASRYISHALDVEDPIAHSYHLEVSSPGLDRPLKKLEEFDRFQGRKVKIKLHQPKGGQKVLRGELKDRLGETIFIVVEDGKEIEIPFRDIFSARLQLNF
jgi:ribosome maturation factor RimP